MGVVARRDRSSRSRSIMRINIGIRLLLPVVTFVVIVAVARICRAMPSITEWRASPQRRRSGVGASHGWSWSDLRIWPDAIRYTNELWGNTDRGYLYVSDSNFDWGQGLPELAEWQQHACGHR